MLDKLKINPIQDFINAMTKLAKLANLQKEEWKKEDTEIEQFSLSKLMACFRGAKKETFLTDNPIEACKEGVLRHENVDYETAKVGEKFREQREEEFELAKYNIPEGTQLTLVVCATRGNGLELPQKYFDDTSNGVYPYFKILYSNPNDESGEALGMDNLKPVPYLKLFPQEFIDHTSFVIEYVPGKERKEGETDYQYLSRMLDEKYEKLRKLAHEHLPE